MPGVRARASGLCRRWTTSIRISRSKRTCSSTAATSACTSRLGARAQSRINALSGGMKRRLTLARALINDPDLIFLDEPTTGLDPQARHLIWERLKQLLAQGKTIFLTTHFMDEAERLCGRVAIMDHGRIIAEGPPR